MTAVPSPASSRLDLFLKNSRLVKRRSLASTLCRNGYVILNGKTARAGKEVRAGDRVEIRYPRKKVLVEVTEIPGGTGRGQSCFRVLEERAVEEELF